MTLQELKQCFVYTPDKSLFTDHYSVMRKNGLGQYRGDCDDYAVTYAWILCGCNLWKFLQAVLLKGSIRFYRVKSVSGEYHIVGKLVATDEWFDNWVMDRLPYSEFFKRTKHHLITQQPRILIARFLLVGWFMRR